ncbi:hypothetical protein [Vibrio sp. 99K-1]|uniref:hypothetical protein n=1 Tax=Vibrio sp. 99K-1 TaxID=2607603 RepID=UPI001493B34D|nr:hypothetical protein [Vibrio sp. 99K-1]NOI88442.1 hypothetical protein [Vibrio sp. 99K-1]
MNKNVVEFISEKAQFAPGVKGKVLAFLNYLEKEQDDFYYPLAKIKKITDLDVVDSMSVARFFCSKSISLLEPKFIYINHDDDVIEITKTDFNSAIVSVDSSFKTEDSTLLQPFDNKRLKFYFVRKVEVEYEEYEW